MMSYFLKIVPVIVADCLFHYCNDVAFVIVEEMVCNQKHFVYSAVIAS